MPRLHIGLPHVVGKLDNYAKRYGLVEVQVAKAPSDKVLRRWRESVPPSFAFSVVLGAAALEDDAAVKSAIAMAAALEARCMLLHTPSSVRPTKKNRQRIIALRGKLPEHGHVMCWAADGMWERDDVLRTAFEGGWLPVFDAARDELVPGTITYTRIRGIGGASQLGIDSVELIALQLRDRRESFVVADPEIAGRLTGELPRRIDVPRKGPTPLMFRPESDDLAIDDEEQ